MQQLLRHQIWIVAAALVVFFTNLGVPHLWDEDETLYATCAREMFQNNDWVVPTFNGELLTDKPPLTFWMMICGFKLFGVTELAVRFWSAVFGVGTALLTYHLGRLLFRAEVGFWAGLIVVSTLIFPVSARAATVDSALVFFNTLALMIFVLAGVGARPTAGEAATTSLQNSKGFTPGSWLSFLVLYAAIGAAVLGKGPVGVVLPVAAMGLFLLVANRTPREPSLASLQGNTSPVEPGRGRLARWLQWIRLCLLESLRLLTPRRVFGAAWQLRPLTAILVVAAIAVPWYVMVGLRTHGEWLNQFFGEHNLQRAFRPFQSHSGPIVYYIPAIFIGFFPWSVFLVPSLVALVRRLRQGDAWRTGLVFLSCWMGLWLVFWSIVSTKLPHYVLPMYPAMAIMTAMFLDDWLRKPAQAGRGWLTNALVTVIVVGVGLLVAMPILARFFLPGEGWLGLVGLIPMAGGAICLWLARRQQDRIVLATFAVMSVAFVTAIFGVAVLRVDRHQNAPSMMAAVREDTPRATQLASYRFVRQSFVWCSGQRIERLRTADDLQRFLRSAENPYVITSSDYETEVEKAFPGVFQVFARQRRFLRSGEVLVLARRSEPVTASREVGSRQ